MRDWNVSRQLWWGHRIPAWYCPDGHTTVTADPAGPAACEVCSRPAAELRQDDDIFDTWFSSGLWPFSTLGWPDKTADMERFYPGSVMETAYDIIFFWVARMMMMGIHLTGQPPFHTVYLSGLIRDPYGQKMSKTKGNSVDPLETIETVGADALRFALVNGTAPGNDSRLGTEKLDNARNFTNKLWNAARFVLGARPASIPADAVRRPADWETSGPADRWILSRSAATIVAVDEAMRQYAFGDATQLLYEAIWNEYCDWAVELAKTRLADETLTQAERETTWWTLVDVLDCYLRLLHPFMPFVTEELWQAIPHDGETLALASWPKAKKSWFDAGVEREVTFLQDVVVAVRNLRVEQKIAPGKSVPVVVRGTPEQLDLLERLQSQLLPLARIESLTLARDGSRPAVAASAVVEGAEVFLPLAGLIDLDEERARLAREAEKLLTDLESVKKKLRNQDFLAKARPEIVEKEHVRLAQLEETLEKLKKAQQSLSTSRG